MDSYMDQLLQTPSSRVPTVSDFVQLHRAQLSDAVQDLLALLCECERLGVVAHDCLCDPYPIQYLLSVQPHSIDLSECPAWMEQIVETTVDLEARLEAASSMRGVLADLKHQASSINRQSFSSPSSADAEAAGSSPRGSSSARPSAAGSSPSAAGAGEGTSDSSVERSLAC